LGGSVQIVVVTRNVRRLGVYGTELKTLYYNPEIRDFR